jgi:hypothetical protein
MTTLNTIAKPRKSLADQIDRLDTILDGLSDELAQAVADSVKDAVRMAVVEALTSPTVITLLRNGAQNDSHPSHSKPASGSKKGWWAGVGEWTAGAWQGVCGWCGWAWQGLRRKGKDWSGRLEDTWAGCRKTCGEWCSSALQWVKVVWSFRIPLLLALAVAFGFGLIAFFGGPIVAAVVVSLSGFAATILALLVWSVWATVPNLKTVPWKVEVPETLDVVTPEQCH